MRLLQSVGPTQGVHRGLYLDYPQTLIPEGGLAGGQNVEPGLGTIRKVPGYDRYSENEVPGTGPVMALSEFVTSAGVRSIMAATRTRLSKYSISTNQFVDLTGGANLLTGATTDRISTAVLNDLFIVNNGKDNIKKSSGTTWADLGGSPPKALGMAMWENLLLLWNLNPGTGPEYGIQWSAINAPETWTPVFGQIQGSRHLRENALPLMAGAPLRRNFLLYKDGGGGVYALTFTGNSYDPILHELILPEMGTFSVHGVVVYRDTHFFFGSDEQLYMFSGGAPTPIGDPVKNRLFRRINWDKRRAAYVTVNPSRHQVVFAVPEGSADVVTRGYIYSLDTGGWGEREWPFMCGAHVRDPETTLIDDLVGTIDSLEGTIDDLSALGREIYLVGGEQTSPFVYRYGVGEHADTVAIDSWVEGRWVGQGGRYTRARGIEADVISASGLTAELGQASSLAGPVSYSALGPLSENTRWRADANTSAQFLVPRLRSQGTYDHFEISSYRVDVYPLGRR